MEIKFQVPEIFVQIQELKDRKGLLNQSQAMLENIMYRCNTYEDIERMEKEGLLSLEGLLEILQNYSEVVGSATGCSKLFDSIRTGFETAPLAKKKIRKAI